MATARHSQHMGVPVRRRQLAHFDPMPKGLLTMWIVRLTDQRMPYGPFDDRASADRFREFLTAEVDPATVEQLCDPVTELLNWRDAQEGDRDS